VVQQRRINYRPVVLVVTLVGLMTFAKVFNLGEQLGLVRDWIESLGVFGPAAFCALYIVAVLAMIPGFAITVVAGALFGAFWGSVYVSFSSTIGAALCFLIARYLARGSVSTWLSGSPKFRQLDDMTEQHGAAIVAITRLVPLFPFNLLNYGFGLTKVRFSTYVLWSWMCMLPGTVIYVVGTDAFITTLREGRIPWALLGALAVISAATFFVVRMAGRKIAQPRADESGAPVTSQVSEA
jgi:uncharacterized membrane protein YdjX (TVP38/TMEM64 family)